MVHRWQFVPTPVLEVPDLACIDTPRAEQIAVLLGVVGLLGLVTAWRTRDRAAASGHATLWAFSALLVGALQTVLTLALVAPGCATSHTVAWMLGCASPWALAGAFFRTGVAPLPPPLDAPPS
jgi:drug/metabolite transporter (DMT)-like permease